MFEHEYNPVHMHQGTSFTGLSSVMILKLPKSFGVEYSSPDAPQNGKLQILGSVSGQFANVDYQPDIKERDFIFFHMICATVYIHLTVLDGEELLQQIWMCTMIQLKIEGYLNVRK